MFNKSGDSFLRNNNNNSNNNKNTNNNNNSNIIINIQLFTMHRSMHPQSDVDRLY